MNDEELAAQEATQGSEDEAGASGGDVDRAKGRGPGATGWSGVVGKAAALIGEVWDGSANPAAAVL